MMGGNSVYIGQPVISATSYAVPYIDSNGLLAQDPTKFKYNGSYFSLHGDGTGTASALLHVLGTTTSHIGKFDIGVDFNQVTQPTTPPTLALIASAGNIDNGVHFYRITYVTAVGETQLNTGTGATTTAITTSAGNQQVAISNLPVSSDYRVTHVRIYRSTVNQPYYIGVKYVGQVANGVTTFTDNISDASRGSVDNFARSNTTNRFITINGSPSSFLSSTDSYWGYRAGEGAILGTAGGGENQFFGANVGINPLGSKNVAIGYSIPVGLSDSSVLIGHGAAGIGLNFYNSIIMGRNAAINNSYCVNSVILGGAKGTALYAASYITSVGAEALNAITTGASMLSVLGAFAARNLTTSSGSIAIGAYVDLPSATVNGQLNIGNVIYGLGMYNVLASSSTPTSGGSIGIGKNTTGAARLELAAGTTSIAPFKLFAGSNKTTAAAGEVEFDGTDITFSPSTTRYKFAFLERAQTWSGLQTFTMPTSSTVALIAKATGTPSTELVQFQKSNGTVFGWVSAQNAGLLGHGVLTMKDSGLADITTTAFHTDDQNAYSLCLYNDTVSAFYPGFSVFTYNTGHTSVSNENNSPLSFCTNGLGNYRIWIEAAGQVGIGGVTAPTARLHLAAGTATASTGPIKFSLPGVLLATPEAGVMETTADDIFYTATTGTTRRNMGGFVYRAITALRTLDGSDELVDCTANTFTVTLPTAVGFTREYIVKNSGTGVITIATTSSQTIDGVASGVLTLVQYDVLHFRSNGSNWIIV